MKNNKSSYLAGLIGCALLLMTANVCANRKHFLDRTIKNQTTLTSAWMEIVPSPPLKPERDVQAIMIDVEKDYAGELERGGIVRLPDGSAIKPEVQLLDMDGDTYNLELNGQFGNDRILYSIPDELKGKQFRRVLIRSERPIHCRKIIWRCYFYRDVD